MQYFPPNIENQARHRRRCVLVEIQFFVWVAVISGLRVLPVQGACGDYLDQGHSQLVQLSMEIGILDASDPIPPGDLPPEGACHGPYCQRNPDQYPLSTPLDSLDRLDRCIWMERIILSATLQSSILICRNEVFIMPEIASRMERPPKLQCDGASTGDFNLHARID